MTAEQDGGDSDPKKDAFALYGPAILSYFELQRSLIRALGLLALLAAFQMFLFHREGGLGFVRESVPFTADYSFGNMGFSTSQCSKSVIRWDRHVRMNIQCQKTTEIDAVLDSGIILSKAYPEGADSVFSTCALSDEAKRDGDHPWMQHFDQEAFAAELIGKCKGSSECNIEFDMQGFTDGRI